MKCDIASYFDRNILPTYMVNILNNTKLRHDNSKCHFHFVDNSIYIELVSFETGISFAIQQPKHTQLQIYTLTKYYYTLHDAKVSTIYEYKDTRIMGDECGKTVSIFLT